MTTSLIFPREISRLSFAIRYVLFLVAVWIAQVLLVRGDGMEPGVPKITVSLLAAVVALFAVFYMFRHTLIARLRHIGLHGAWSLLIFVPIVNLIFVLILLLVPKDGFRKSSGPVATS